MRKHRILVADDHPIVRDGLIAALNAEPDLEVCGQAASSSAIFEHFQRETPDLLLTDLFLGREDGITLIKNLLAPWPALKILVISMQDESLYAPRCWRAGALGYVSKLEPTAEILAGLRSVLRGRLYFKPEVFLGGHASAEAADLLTDREIHILQLIGRGLKPSQIAEELKISPRTVDTHRENIKQKLGVATSAQLMQHALQLRDR